MGPACNLDLLRADLLQGERDMNPPEYQHALIDFDFTTRDGRKTITTGRNLARLQRAPEGPEQSTTRRRHDIVESRGVRVRHLSLDAVVAGDRPVRAETDWL